MDLFTAAGIVTPTQTHFTGERPTLSIHLLTQTVKLTKSAQKSSRQPAMQVPSFLIKFNYRIASVLPSDKSEIIHTNNATKTTIGRNFTAEHLLLCGFLVEYELKPIGEHLDLDPDKTQLDLYISAKNLDPIESAVLFHKIRNTFNRAARSNITKDRLYPIKDLRPISPVFQAMLHEFTTSQSSRSFQAMLVASFQSHEDNVLPSVLAHLKDSGLPVYDAAIGLKAELTLNLASQYDIDLGDEGQVLSQSIAKVSRSNGSFFVLPHNGALLHLTKAQLLQSLDTIISTRIQSGDEEIPLSRAVALAANEGFTPTEELKALFATAQKLTAYARDHIEIDPIMPPSVLMPPRKGQGTALALMEALFHLGLGCLLADTMSGGKTYMTLAHCHRLKAAGLIGGYILYVTTANHKAQLVDKCAHLFCETLFNVFGSKADIDPSSKNVGGLRVLVVSHDDIVRHSDMLSRQQFDVIILDEAHKLNGVNSKRRKAFLCLKTIQTILATGTPFNNKTADLYSLIDLAVPGLLGNEHQFAKTFALPIKNGDGPTLQAFAALIAPFFLMRNEEQLGLKLPKLIPETIYVKTTKVCDRYHNSLVNDLLLFSQVNQLSSMVTRSRFRHLYLKIHLFASFPEAVIPELSELKGFKSPKLAKILTYARASKAEHRPFIIFANSIPFLTEIEKTLLEAGLKVQLCTGQQSPKLRRQHSGAFTAGDYDGLILSLKANNEAIDYPTATTVILAESWYNPFAEEQAIFRARRTNNHNPDIKLFRILTRYPIEDRIIELANGKRTLGNLLLASGAFDASEDSLSVDDQFAFANSLAWKNNT